MSSVTLMYETSAHCASPPGKLEMTPWGCQVLSETQSMLEFHILAPEGGVVGAVVAGGTKGFQSNGKSRSSLLVEEEEEFVIVPLPISASSPPSVFRCLCCCSCRSSCCCRPRCCRRPRVSAKVKPEQGGDARSRRREAKRRGNFPGSKLLITLPLEGVAAESVALPIVSDERDGLDLDHLAICWGSGKKVGDQSQNSMMMCKYVYVKYSRDTSSLATKGAVNVPEGGKLGSSVVWKERK
mmetsp:Transcript_42011/g.90239  ORF Transcript_42011/g.90239 Transcript_42011/m.90239 type:complete len:240 (+) Transcript_42011:317-1036(+)